MFTNITVNEKDTPNTLTTAKSTSQFRVLLVYPNLPLMLVPPLAIGLFTRIMKEQGYQVDLFDTTGYISDEKSSPANRVKFLQAREFDYKKDLGVEIREDLEGGTGCKSNPKDSLRLQIPKLTSTEVELLTVHNYL